jgi:hypothetical protein
MVTSFTVTGNSCSALWELPGKPTDAHSTRGSSLRIAPNNTQSVSQQEKPSHAVPNYLNTPLSLHQPWGSISKEPILHGPLCGDHVKLIAELDV